MDILEKVKKILGTEDTKDTKRIKVNLVNNSLVPYIPSMVEDKEESYIESLRYITKLHKDENIRKKIKNSINKAVAEGEYSTEVHIKSIDHAELENIKEKLKELGFYIEVSEFSELYAHNYIDSKKIFINWEITKDEEIKEVN